MPNISQQNTNCHKLAYFSLNLMKPDNTNSVCKGKSHCTADDLLFDWFRFQQTSKSVATESKADRLYVSCTVIPYNEVSECSVDYRI